MVYKLKFLNKSFTVYKLLRQATFNFNVASSFTIPIFNYSWILIFGYYKNDNEMTMI